MKQIMSAIQANKFRLTLLIILSLPLIGCEILWLYPSDDYAELKNWGLNAFTEIIGIIITIVIVDELLQKQEERRLLPLKIAAHRDVGRFIQNINYVWSTAYQKCAQTGWPANEPTTMIFTAKYFNEILNRLNLDNPAPVVPKRTWGVYLQQKEDEFRQQGEKILERYTTVLEPEIYELISRILNNFLNQNTGISIIETIKALDRQHGVQKHPLLGNYFFRSENDLKELYDVHDWYCKKQLFYQAQNKKES